MPPTPRDPWHLSWQAMHALAWRSLNHSRDMQPKVSREKPFHGLPRLRHWDDAGGFGCETEPTTLTVYELFGEDDRREPVVREAIWNRSADYRRMEQAIERFDKPVMLKPTIEVRDAAVPFDRLESLLADIMAVRVPVVWFRETEAITCDVGKCGFEFFSHDQPPAALKLEWACDVPPEWEPILEWSWRLRRLLEECLASSSRPS